MRVGGSARVVGCEEEHSHVQVEEVGELGDHRAPRPRRTVLPAANGLLTDRSKPLRQLGLVPSVLYPRLPDDLTEVPCHDFMVSYSSNEYSCCFGGPSEQRLSREDHPDYVIGEQAL